MADLKTVWLVCGDDIYSSRGVALRAARDLLDIGMKKLRKDSIGYRTLTALLETENGLELALDYWNLAAHPAMEGEGGQITVEEKTVRGSEPVRIDDEDA